MHLILLRAFQRQVEQQCTYALIAIGDLNRALLTGSQPDLWMAVQTFLGACANVSKACWGQNGSKTAERKPLRDSLQIGDDSPLQPTKFRNHFEHFDERLDRWWAESPNHNMANQIIGPPNAIGGLQDIEIFKWYDPTEATLVFWSDRFAMNDVVAEIKRILPVARTEAGKPHWEPPSTAGMGQ